MGLLEVTSYCDDPMRARHLELYVGVVGDSHKLDIARSAQDGVVGTGKICYFKGECFCVEIGSTSERCG